MFDVGCGTQRLQVPTPEVNREMHLPHGSDWSSIREAGRKPVMPRTSRGQIREQVARSSQPERVSRVHAREQTRVIATIRHNEPNEVDRLAPKWGRIEAGIRTHDRFSLSLHLVESATLQLRKTDTGNVVTSPRSPCGRSRSRYQPQARELMGWSKKLMPRATPRICRRRPRQQDCRAARKESIRHEHGGNASV